uniref:Uncharacterized protein n=1 Tax=Molossus molossus TaxID=27622 RepID=A0A7J8I165_MOLMO|nr:hypothetical protein HJG59_010892 [Molossus molossus]
MTSKLNAALSIQDPNSAPGSVSYCSRNGSVALAEKRMRTEPEQLSGPLRSVEKVEFERWQFGYRTDLPTGKTETSLDTGVLRRRISLCTGLQDCMHRGSPWRPRGAPAHNASRRQTGSHS